MSQEKMFQEMIQRLNVLIALQLDLPIGERPASISSKIERLQDLGLNSTAIARIIGRPAQYVTAVLSKKKKRR